MYISGKGRKRNRRCYIPAWRIEFKIKTLRRPPPWAVSSPLRLISAASVYDIVPSIDNVIHIIVFWVVHEV